MEMHGLDPYAAGWSGLVAAITTAIMGLLNWWITARREKLEAKINERASKTSDEQTQTAIEAQVQAVYGGIIRDMQERMDHVTSQERKCREDMALLMKRVKAIEAAQRKQRL
jgi:hypothetical protein